MNDDRDRLYFALAMRGLTEHLAHDATTITYTNAGDVHGLTPDARWAQDETITKYAKNVWDTLKALFEGRSQSHPFRDTR